MKNINQRHNTLRQLLFTGLLAAGILATGSVQAIPTLQVGAPGGSGEGAYANYQASTSNPTETNTAITGQTTLYFAGVFGPNTIALGAATATGGGYSSVDPLLSVFDGHGAIVVASVAEGQLANASGLTIGGQSAFSSSTTIGALFPNSHDSVKDAISDFLFFDIGSFIAQQNAVPDFADETGAADGEIKTLLIGGVGSLAWIHFDLVALETYTTGSINSSQGLKINTSFDNNPGSHDVTWKNQVPEPSVPVPEPNVIVLLGLGLMSMGWSAIRSKNQAC